ncbi:hypothetical protein MUP79_09675 [Candidatus Bathyarchaeota archaeon]|nr:hypothetical protein [Candidatus Bathyarchaeota archaeon]
MKSPQSRPLGNVTLQYPGLPAGPVTWKLICICDSLKLKSDIEELVATVTLKAYPPPTVKTAGHMLVAVIFSDKDMFR